MNRFRKWRDAVFLTYPMAARLDHALGAPLYAFLWAVGAATIARACGASEIIQFLTWCVTFISILIVTLRHPNRCRGKLARGKGRRRHARRLRDQSALSDAHENRAPRDGDALAHAVVVAIIVLGALWAIQAVLADPIGIDVPLIVRTCIAVASLLSVLAFVMISLLKGRWRA